jgi:hypothetical protein
MRFFVLHVFSTAPNEYFKGASEAYVSCWIKDSCRDSALTKAAALIHARGWKIAEIVEEYPISREDYALKPEDLEYYEQALIDDEVLVFFVPPKEGGKECHA